MTALLALLAAATQDPSDAIYDENHIRTWRLTMPAADWQAIVNADGETWRRATLVWEGPNGAETIDGVGVKASGHGTLTTRQKQSIRISFNEFEFDAAKRRWRNINRVKLDSMEGNVDHSMSRDRVAFWLLRQAGNAAPRLAHCHLHVNGAYKGVYIAVEPVRKDFARYRWGGDDDGNLFEQDGHGSGAYDWRGTSPGSYVPGWFIEENAPAPVNYSDLVQLMDIINNKAGDDRRDQLANLIDYPVFMRHLACTTVYGDGDDIAHWGGGWCNNHFWYHHEGGKMRIIKWDPDASQGRFYPDATQPLGFQWGQSDMVDWISGDPVAWNDYKSAVAAVLSGPAAGVQAKIDSIYNQIRNAVYADPLKSFSNSQYDAGKNTLKDWWTRRTQYLAGQVSVNNAAFVSQTVPASMTAGQTYSVTVRMRNTGSTTWAAASYALGSQNPTDNTTWDADGRVAPASNIAPNQEAVFTWNVTAPSTAGTYNFQWRMRQSGVEWFGATTPNVAVVVSAVTTPPPPPPTSANDAAFVSQTVPATMTAGQTYTVTVRMRNTGTSTWAAGYSLGSQNPENNTTWDVDGRIPPPSDIAPNQEAVFSWTVTAPATAGTYNFQWRMRQSGVEWFGATTPNVAVVVSTAAPPPPTTPEYDADFVSQTVPAAMVAGQSYTVTVVMKNTGTDTWRPGDDDRLASQNPVDNTTWGASRINLPAGAAIATGQNATFTWTLTAPSAPGVYNFQWRMRQSLIDLYFGDTTPNVAVSVTTSTTPPPPAGTNLAAFVSQAVPAGMAAGADVQVTVTLRNDGTTTWTHAAGYRLSSRGPRDNSVWGINRVFLPPTASIAPGQSHTFTFEVTAPATAGTYPMSWSMVQEGVDWFDAVTPVVNVTVTGTAGPAPSPAPTFIRGADSDNGDHAINDKCSASAPGLPASWGLAGLIALLALRRTSR